MGPQKPRTWNPQVATVRWFLSWCRRHGWPVGGLALRVDRRAVADDDAKAIPLAELEQLWSRADVPLRERALWRLLYDSAARAEEALGLDVDDLDLANRQAKARTKGGYVRQLHFQTAAARLLAKLVAGRERGPVFLTGRRAGQARPPAAGDLDTATGRARLSYEMAGQLFKRYAGGWHAAPAPPLPPDPPWRAERERAAADGHLPEPAVGGADSSPTGSPRQPPSPGRAAGRSRAPDA